MKNRRTVLLILALVLVCAAVGTVVAYMFQLSQKQQQTLSAAKVSCEVVEAFQNDDKTTNIKTSIAVKNTSNVDAYLRLTLVTYWVDSSGNRVYKQSLSLDDVPYDTEKWLKDGDTYYYKESVKAGGSTGNLFATDKTITLKKEGDYYQVIEVIAEAIQAEPTTAVSDAWGVTLDTNDHIVDPTQATEGNS